MAGGGIIIIRSNVAAAVSDTVLDNIPTCKADIARALKANDPSTWTDNEVHFLLRCIAQAYDNLCGY